MARKKRLPINQMNVVPYIDVMLVLLVIFMVTAPLVQTTTIDLPESSQQQSTEAPADFHVTWLGDNKYTWIKGDGTGETESVAGEQELIKLLKKQMAKNSTTKNTPTVVFSASAKSLYGDVMDRVDGLRSGLPETRVQLLMKRRIKAKQP